MTIFAPKCAKGNSFEQEKSIDKHNFLYLTGIFVEDMIRLKENQKFTLTDTSLLSIYNEHIQNCSFIDCHISH